MFSLPHLTHQVSGPVGSVMRVMRAGRREIKRRAQWAVRGWADEDTWNLDVTLCLRLADQLDHLAENSHSWPGTEEFPTAEHWTADLHSTAERLRRVEGSTQTLEAENALLEAMEAADANRVGPEVVLGCREAWSAASSKDQEEVTRALHWVAEHHQHLWD